jgi:hypothetical protein
MATKLSPEHTRNTPRCLTSISTSAELLSFYVLSTVHWNIHPQRVMSRWIDGWAKPLTNNPFVFWRSHVQISAWRPAKLNEVSVVFLSPSRIVPKLGHECFLPHYFQFIIHLYPFTRRYIILLRKASLNKLRTCQDFWLITLSNRSFLNAGFYVSPGLRL